MVYGLPVRCSSFSCIKLCIIIGYVARLCGNVIVKSPGVLRRAQSVACPSSRVDRQLNLCIFSL
jgi:hypothetical protein